MDEEKSKGFFEELLQKIGVAEYFQKFRFGGFVGKLCVLGGIGAVAIAAIALKLHSEWAILGSVVTVALLIVYVVSKVSAFAKEHPELAMFEGAEILQWEHLKLAAKGVQIPVNRGKPIEEQEAKKLAEDTSGGEK